MSPTDEPSLTPENPGLATWISRGIAQLERSLPGQVGSWLDQEALLGITVLKLLFVVTISLTVLVIYVVLKRTLSAQTSGNAPAWKSALKRISPPVLAFAYAWGLYAILAILLPVTADTWGQRTMDGLGWLLQLFDIVLFFWFLFGLIAVLEGYLKQWTKLTARKWDDVLVTLGMRALRLTLPLLAIVLILPMLRMPAEFSSSLERLGSLLIIAAVGYILYQLVVTGEAAMLDQYRIDTKDNLSMRKIQTQVRMLKRIATVLICLFTVAIMLMEFQAMRRLGASLLTSAGVAGIVIGFAAQKSIATVVAGIQIAFTQPIRIDDVVVVEGEWGRIEEITMTYVVVLIWDLRRLVLPITYFIEKPFQNWTRVSADILGAVFLYVDYAVPIQPLRAELDRLLAASQLWDGKVKVLQVTEAKESALQLRILVSAANSSAAWDLRCEIREKLVDFLQRHYPQALPRLRVEMKAGADIISEHATAKPSAVVNSAGLNPPLEANPASAQCSPQPLPPTA